jgi:hypothetical protein
MHVPNGGHCPAGLRPAQTIELLEIRLEIGETILSHDVTEQPAGDGGRRWIGGKAMIGICVHSRTRLKFRPLS